MIPPARWTSSICTSALAGATLHRHGTRRTESRSMSAIVNGDLALLRGGEQVQHGVGRSAHRDVEAHRILERSEVRDAERGSTVRVVLLVIAHGEVDDQVPRLAEQASRGRRAWPADRAVAGQRQPQRLGQAVHRIGGEHARARAAGRAGGSLDHVGTSSSLIAFVGGRDHRVDQVQRARDRPFEHDLARLHRAAGHEHRGDVEPHRRHQHAGRDLVAIGDAHQRVGAMRVDHVFDAVGDQLAAGQRIEHAAMTHGDPVVHRDRVELLGHAARRARSRARPVAQDP